MTRRPQALDERLAARIEARREQGLLRKPAPVPAARVLCSNDYLGLRDDPALAHAASRAAHQHGTGAGASRLVSGTLPLHAAVEARLADWLRVERCVLFNSGYQANVGLLGALLEPGDLVVSDAWNHASLIDGIRLTKAERVVTPHSDVSAIDRALANWHGTGVALVIVEAIYSMDGDAAPLEALAEVCDRHGATLVVDEAHALGVVGEGGRGLVAKLGLEARVPVRVGTCGKSLGASGAFVAGSAALGAWLENAARSYVYSTAIAPPTLGAIEAAVDVLAAGERQSALQRQIAALRAALASYGWQVPDAASAIVPVIVGEPDVAVRLSEALLRRGWFVQAIRPPTVPPGTSRLRVTVQATYESGLASAFASALTEEARALGCGPPDAPR